MAQLDFTLKVLSPAFVGSVPSGRMKTVHYVDRGNLASKLVEHHPVDPAGIRIPSLRGVLEYWHRALLGHLQPQQVFESQARVFGSTGFGQGARFVPSAAPQFQHGKVILEQSASAFLYLGYGPLQLLKVDMGRMGHRNVATSHNTQHARDAITVGADGQVPEFCFSVRATPEQKREVERSLVLLHLFGGVGARSRRGWGSIEVSASCIPLLDSEQEVVPWFRKLLHSAWSPTTSRTSLPQFSALSAASEIRLTWPPVTDYKEVLKEFYRTFQATRLYYARPRPRMAATDHALEKHDASGNEVTGVPARLAFGMPYHPISRRNGWNIDYAGVPRGQSPEKVENPRKRRASPLFLKVLRLGPQRYVGVALLLAADYFGHSELEVGAFKKTGTRPAPGYQAVLEFLNHNSSWRSVPVTLDGGDA